MTTDMTNAPVEPTPDSGDVLPPAAPENGAPNEETASDAAEVTDTPAPAEAVETAEAPAAPTDSTDSTDSTAPADAGVDLADGLADGLAPLGAADAAADGQPSAVGEPTLDIEDELEEEPVEPDRDWFETVPSTWDEWTELQTQVAESLRVRESFRNWMMNHLDEDAQPMVAGLGRFASGEYAKAMPHLEKAGGELVAKLIVEERVSALLDLSDFRKGEVAVFMADFLEALYRLKNREKFRTPLMLVIDEADAIAQAEDVELSQPGSNRIPAGNPEE